MHSSYVSFFKGLLVSEFLTSALGRSVFSSLYVLYKYAFKKKPRITNEWNFTVVKPNISEGRERKTVIIRQLENYNF